MLHIVNPLDVQDRHAPSKCSYCTLPRMEGAWFKARMKRLGVTQEDLGRVLNCDRTVVSKIIAGRQPLKLDEVLPLAQALDISPFEVLFRAGMWRGRASVIIQTVPVLSAVEAGRFSQPPTEPPRSRNSIVVEYPHGNLFALVVSGDSMNRIAPEGSVVIVDYTARDLRDGDLAVFRQPDGTATFKRYRQQADAWLQPDSDNPRHVPMFPEEAQEIEVIGRVIDIRPEYATERAAE